MKTTFDSTASTNVPGWQVVNDHVVVRSRIDKPNDQLMRTLNVQHSTRNVQLGRGFANRVAVSPAAVRVPPLGDFETSIRRAAVPLNVVR